MMRAGLVALPTMLPPILIGPRSSRARIAPQSLIKPVPALVPAMKEPPMVTLAIRRP
jgi:hypothetical protein